MCEKLTGECFIPSSDTLLICYNSVHLLGLRDELSVWKNNIDFCLFYNSEKFSWDHCVNDK